MIDYSQDERFVPKELQELWTELYERIAYYTSSSCSIYYYDPYLYSCPGFSVGRPQRFNWLCQIYTNTDEEEACYYLGERSYFDVKEYITVLKNIAFL